MFSHSMPCNHIVVKLGSLSELLCYFVDTKATWNPLPGLLPLTKVLIFQRFDLESASKGCVLYRILVLKIIIHLDTGVWVDLIQ